MRKSAICLLLALVAYWSFLSHVQLVYAYKEGDYTYSVDNNFATITAFPRGAATSITIPGTLGGAPVAAIGNPDDRYMPRGTAGC